MINWHACVECYNNSNVMCTKSKHLHNIYGIKFMKLQFQGVPHKPWRRDWRTGSIPCGHWKDAGTFPPPNAKELGMCVTVNWYPPAFSISLDSEEGEERVQWGGLECCVRCGICGVLWGVRCAVLWGVGFVACSEVWDVWSAVMCGSALHTLT